MSLFSSQTAVFAVFLAIPQLAIAQNSRSFTEEPRAGQIISYAREDQFAGACVRTISEQDTLASEMEIVEQSFCAQVNAPQLPEIHYVIQKVDSKGTLGCFSFRTKDPIHGSEFAPSVMCRLPL